MPMNDSQIVQLYWDRDERAIPETAEVYGAYCYTIAQDSEECVNDTYLHTWNAIPPQRPRSLSAFLGRITRNLALKVFHRNRAQKRGGADVTVATSQKSATRFLCPMAIEKFNQQNPTLSVRTTGVFHDRFLILDGKELYHFGASLKDLGRLYCAVSKMDAGFIPSILARI